MFDAGSEFQLKLRKWLANQGISTQVCDPETHEEMTRLNSFHRYFRARYQMQWRKFFENRREYGGPVQWISPKANDLGFAGLSSTVLTSSDAAAVVSADDLKSIEDKGDVKASANSLRGGEPGDVKETASTDVEDEFQFQESWYNEHGSLSQFHMAVLRGAGQRLEVHGSASQCTSLEVHRSV